MKLTTILIAVFFSCSAHAQGIVGIHITSMHLPERENINNINPGIYYRDPSGFVLGTYLNSVRRQSVYLGYTAEMGIWAVTIGAVTGYQKKHDPNYCDKGKIDLPKAPCWSGYSSGAVTLMFAPSVRLPEIMGVTPRLTIIPSLGVNSSVLHISLEKII